MLTKRLTLTLAPKFSQRGALGQAVELLTSDYWVQGSKPGVWGPFILPLVARARSGAHKTLAVKKQH